MYLFLSFFSVSFENRYKGEMLAHLVLLRISEQNKINGVIIMYDKIPKNVFDKEYSTQWKREVEFLKDKGIRYTYAKKNNEYPIVKYKYTKTPELFLALAEFYNQVRNQQFFRDVEDAVKSLEDGYISLKSEDLTPAERKLIGEDDVLKVFNDDTE